MELYLFRHGIAADRTPDGTDDERALTDKGVRRTRQAARGLAALRITPDLLLTSPKRRARQTADLLAEVFDVPVREDVRLAAGNERRDLEAACDAKVHTLILVGHQPDLAWAAERLVFGDTVGRLNLGKAGCIALDWPEPAADADAPTATLEYLLSPGILRHLDPEA